MDGLTKVEAGVENADRLQTRRSVKVNGGRYQFFFAGPNLGCHRHQGVWQLDLEKTPSMRSSNLAGAKGRNQARCFTREFNRSFMATSRGSARMERRPKARGPSSERPWNQPTVFPAARS